MNKKARKAALCAALSRRCEESALTIFEDFTVDQIKTKAFKTVMNALILGLYFLLIIFIDF